MDIPNFSEERIREELVLLGFHNVSRTRLLEIKTNLDKLIQGGMSKNQASFKYTQPLTDPTRPEAEPRRRTVRQTSSLSGGAGQRRPCPSPRPRSDPAFSEEEIEQQLRLLGWDNIPRHRLREMKRDLDGLIRRVISNGRASPPAERGDSSTPRTADPSGIEASPGRMDTRHTFGQTSMPDGDTAQAHERRRRRTRNFTKTTVKDTVSGPEEHPDCPHVSMSAQDNSEPEDDPSSSSSSSSSSSCSETDGLSLGGLELESDDDDGSSTTSAQSEHEFRPRPKGFIVSARGHPHTNNLKKDDPIAKHVQYQKYWELFPCPGEWDRAELRTEIREKLAYQPPPSRRQRGVLVPNKYVVPTSKKRSAVRWDVRCDLANFLMPIPAYPSELLF